MSKTILTLLAVFLFTCQAYTQQYVSVSLRDSKSPAVISNAVVEELASGQTLLTDSSGEGEFLNPVSAGTNVSLRVTAPGFPTHYFERYIPDYGAGFDFAINHSLELTQKNEFLSPILGPAGGSKSVNLPTGYLLYSSPNDSSPTEYFQTVSATLPAGSLTESYRIGLSMIPGAGQAENLMNVLQLGAETSVLGQFQLEWLDISGSSVMSPVLTQPLRIEMSAAAIFFATELTTGWQVQLYKFDESTMSWTPLTPESSGVDSNGLMWADVTTSGYYSFMGWSTELETSTARNTRWRAVDWLGPAEDDADVTCPNLPVNQGGAQSYLDVRYDGTESTKLSGSVSLGLSTKLKILGLKSESSVEATTGRQDYWGTFKEKSYGWSNHAYAGEGQGKIYLHSKGFIIEDGKYGVEGPIQTGYTIVKKLTARKLSPDSGCTPLE